jgi:hypothetical protein
MALKKCTDCGMMISRGASTCPGCGKPQYGARARRVLLLTLLQVAALVVALAWIFWRFGLLHFG